MRESGFLETRVTQQPTNCSTECAMQYGSRAVTGQCKHYAYSTGRSYVKGHRLEKETSEFLIALAG